MGAETRLEPSINKLMESLCFRADLSRHITAFCACLIEYSAGRKTAGTGSANTFLGHSSSSAPVLWSLLCNKLVQSCSAAYFRNNLLCPPRGPAPGVQQAAGIPSCHPCQCSCQLRPWSRIHPPSPALLTGEGSTPAHCPEAVSPSQSLFSALFRLI